MASEKCNFLPEAESRRGCSEPTFMLFRVRRLAFRSQFGCHWWDMHHPFALISSSFAQNGVCKEVVHGSNTPKLNELIMSLTPAMADADDIEVSVHPCIDLPNQASCLSTISKNKPGAADPAAHPPFGPTFTELSTSRNALVCISAGEPALPGQKRTH